MLDYIRIACAVPAVKVGDVKKNTADICAFMEKADAQNVDIILFPELAMTGYTCGDLFYQETLHNAVEAGLKDILSCSEAHPALTCVVGLPVRMGMNLANCAAVISGGQLRGVVPKTYLPDYGGTNESRWFSNVDDGSVAIIHGEPVPVRSDILYRVGDTVMGIEICEDFFAPITPSQLHVLNGAEVVVNLAACAEQVGKKADRSAQTKAHSQRCKCVYAFVSAGFCESTTDLVFSGHSVIAENGTVLAESDGEIGRAHV